MSLARPRVKLPSTARPGEVVAIRCLLSHPMESGLRQGPDGTRVPRSIVRRFECRFEGETVLACDLEPGMAANPFFDFSVRVEKSGTFRFHWISDDGEEAVAEAAIQVG